MQVRLQKVQQEVMESNTFSEGLVLIDKQKVLEIVRSMEQHKLQTVFSVKMAVARNQIP